MYTAQPTIPEILARLATVLPQRRPEEQRVARHLYHALAAGQPVSREHLARSCSLPSAVTDTVCQGFGSRIRHDAAGRIVAFGGLSLRPTAHRLTVDGRTLYTWCAWDILFLPAILAQPARVVSACPVTGTPIHLQVTPEGITHCEPASTVVSFVLPEPGAYYADIVANFCCYVWFFRSAADGAVWIAEHPGAFLLSIDEAYELGQRRMAALFDAL